MLVEQTRDIKYNIFLCILKKKKLLTAPFIKYLFLNFIQKLFYMGLRIKNSFLEIFPLISTGILSKSISRNEYLLFFALKKKIKKFVGKDKLIQRLFYSFYLKNFLYKETFNRKSFLIFLEKLKNLHTNVRFYYLNKFIQFSRIYNFSLYRKKLPKIKKFSISKKISVKSKYYRSFLVVENFFKLTVTQLVLANVYLGANRDSYNLMLKPFYLMNKNGFTVFNLRYTNLQFRLLTLFIIKVMGYRQKILVINDSEYFKINSLIEYKNVLCHDGRWVGGSLTNFRVVGKCQKFLNKNFSSNTLGILQGIKSTMPSLMFLFNTNNSRWALFEGFNLRIPVSGVINTDGLFFESLSYAIVGNTESFESLYLYLSVLKSAAFSGIIGEKLNILNLGSKKRLKRI